LTVVPVRVPCTTTRAPVTTALEEALVLPLEYVVDDCSSTVTVCPVRSVTVKVPEETLATVPTTPEPPVPAPKNPPRAAAPPELGAVRLDGVDAVDAVELRVVSAVARAATVNTSTPTRIQAVVALRRSVPRRRRPPPAPEPDGPGGGHPYPGGGP